MKTNQQMTILKARLVFATAQGFERDMYGTSLFRKYGITRESSPMKINQIDLAKQILLIRKTANNILRMANLDMDRKVPYPAKINISRNLGYLTDAAEVFKEGFDTEEFQKNLEEFNEYIDSHIFYQCGHKIFRTLNKDDVKNQPSKEDGSQPSTMEIHAQVKQKFDSIGRSFGEILYDTNKEKEMG